MKTLIAFCLLFTLPVLARADSTTQVPVGGPVTLSCTVGSGSTPFTYQWYLNSMALSGATGATLAIPSFSSANAGLYQCRVGNSVGNAMSDNATLTVAAPPPVVTPPAQTPPVGAKILVTQPTK